MSPIAIGDRVVVRVPPNMQHNGFTRRGRVVRLTSRTIRVRLVCPRTCKYEHLTFDRHTWLSWGGAGKDSPWAARIATVRGLNRDGVSA